MEALASVRMQSYPHMEAIVVDDASTDGTGEWLSRRSEPWIKPMRFETPVGRGKAMNEGVRRAEHDWLLFLDDDDVLLEDGLRHLAQAATRQVVAVIGGAALFDTAGHRRKMPHPRRARTGPMWPAVLAGWNVGRGQILIRRDAFERAGRWDETSVISDDIDMWLRVTRLGDTRVIPRYVYAKRVHPGNTAVPQLRRLDRDMRLRFVDGLPAHDRVVGAGAVETLDLWLTAHDLYHDERDYRGAARLYRQAIRRAHATGSATLPPGLWRGAFLASVGSVPGARAFLSWSRELDRAVRRRIGRYPDLVKDDEGTERQGP